MLQDWLVDSKIILSNKSIRLNFFNSLTTDEYLL